MVRELIHDPFLLARKSRCAVREDLPILDDLLETLTFHRQTCVGMAANMIGQTVRIIVFMDGGKAQGMLNPEILKAEGQYDTEEGCLSLEGVRPCKRFKSIKVKYQNLEMKERFKTYTGWTAQIIQHEIDHLFGIII